MSTTLYLDHASTTPCRKEVWEIMRTYSLIDYGNPNSLHKLGRRARKAVEQARSDIAEHLGCSGNEIVFTSGGSESDNLALCGVAYANRNRGRHIVTTKIEHLAVLHTCESLEAEGFDVTYLGVNEFGLVNPDEVLKAIRQDTVLVSIGHTNNEIGTIQPIEEITRRIKQYRPDIVVHTDAVQAVGHVEIDVNSLGVDLLSFTAQKFYGPKGIGGLFVRDGIQLQPQITGVRRKRGLEFGTLSVPLIMGMALALKLACQEIQSERNYWVPIRDRIIEGLLLVDGSRLNGHSILRLPTNISCSFLGVSGEDIVLQLDRLDIFASTGSACTSGVLEPSHVLISMGLSRRWALGTLRLSLGHGCHEIDPELLVEQVKLSVARLRSTNYSSTRVSNPRPSEYVSPSHDRLMTMSSV